MPSPDDRPADSSVLVVGNGPPLVVFPGLAHGPVTNPLAYRGLAHVTQRRIYVINRPLGLPRGLTMPDLAARHAKIIAQHFSEPVDLFGASTGGAIALQLAVDHPSLVNRLIIAAAASWLGTEGRQKLRRFGDEVAQGRSGAKVLASVLAAPPKSWLMAFIMWAAHRLRPGPIPTDMLATIDAEVGFDVTPASKPNSCSHAFDRRRRRSRLPSRSHPSNRRRNPQQPFDHLSPRRPRRHHDESPFRPRRRGISRDAHSRHELKIKSVPTKPSLSHWERAGVRVLVAVLLGSSKILEPSPPPAPPPPAHCLPTAPHSLPRSSRRSAPASAPIKTASRRAL